MNTTKVFLLNVALSIYVLSLVIFNPTYASVQLDRKNNQTNNYLAKPTGEYRVGFEDFYLINDNLCPDPNYSDKTKKDFNKGNTKKCHEIMARIYYPTLVKDNLNNRSPYYEPLIESMQSELKSTPGIRLGQINKLSTIKSYTINKAPIIADKLFPVVIFSPGFGAPAQLYENIITELVSQGYIVIGVNTVFINGNLIMPDGRQVNNARASSDEEVRTKFVPMQVKDIFYTYDKIKKLNKSNKLFASMDLNAIGLLGHSIGARSVTEIAGQNPHWLKAVTALDMAPYKSGQPQRISVSYMHIINANYKTFWPWPPADFTFVRNKKYRAVTLSPAIDNINHSQHMSYADFSTLQYLPVMVATSKQQELPDVDVKFTDQRPSEAENKIFDKATFLIVKNRNGLEVFMYYPQESGVYILSSIQLIKGLEQALSMGSEHKVKKILQEYFATLGNFGDGDGWEITHSISTYLVQFFDNVLKNKENNQLIKCEVLSSQTMIECGTLKF